MNRARVLRTLAPLLDKRAIGKQTICTYTLVPKGTL